MKLLPTQYSKKIEAGTDEAGRGCLAGPVSAAAVIFSENYSNPDLNDYSKEEWTEYLCHEERQFDECDWRMTDLDAGPTGNYYKPSEKALQVTFNRFFNND